MTSRLAIVIAIFAPMSLPAQENWAQWRGPLGTGVAPDAKPPLEWSETKNIRWKTELPGKGHSTPVVWGDQIFLTTAIPYGDAIAPRFVRVGAHDNNSMTRAHEFVVLAVSRKSGKILWKETVHKATPHEATHFTASVASASPVTDGERVYAFFGSNGLYCLDTAGKLVWKKDLGQMHSKHGHGEGSSPALHGDTLVVNWDDEEQSFLVALDKRTGKQRWRVGRATDTSWSSPIIVEHAGKPQVIVPGTNKLRAYDLTSGEVIWECGGLSSNVVATPVYADGVVYAGSSYDTRAMFAVKLDGAKGDVTGSANVLWFRRRGTPYVPSPLLYGDTIYNLQHYQGVLVRINAKTGEDRGDPVRLPAIRDVYSSPVAANDRIYITSRDGVTQVLAHGEPPRVLATNRLDDSFSASAVIIGRDMLLRGERALYCIGEPWIMRIGRVLLLIVLVLIPACSRGKAKSVRLQQQWNAKMKETADLLAGVIDVSSAKAAEPKLAASMRELDRLNEELSEHYDPEDVPSRDKDPMIAALAEGIADFQRAHQEVLRISKNPDLVAALGATWQQLPGVVIIEATKRGPKGK